jgi:4-hydroxy-tetrahydrodipicolinate synthase
LSGIGRAPKFGRLLTAMVTPFDERDRVDLREAARIARWLVEQGNDGLIVCGTTGESPALSDDEKIALFRATKEAVGDRAAIVAGTGGNNTEHSIELSVRAEKEGVDGILAVVPYYNKPPQDGMIRHFGAIAEATKLPVIVYNIPSRTGANMLPATLLELARKHKNVAGVKESSGDLAQITAIVRDRRAGFGVWSGDDHLLLPLLAIGGDGLISVASHLCSRELRELIDAYGAGDVARAARIHQDLAALIATLFATTSPIPVKWAMNRLGFACGPCRSPLGTMPQALAATLEPMLAPYRARVREAALTG